MSNDNASVDYLIERGRHLDAGILCGKIRVRVRDGEVRLSHEDDSALKSSLRMSVENAGQLSYVLGKLRDHRSES